VELHLPDTGEPEADLDRTGLSPSRWLTLVIGTAVCLLAGMLLVGGTPTPTATVQLSPFQPTPAPLSTPAVTFSVPFVALGDNLIIGYICSPVIAAGSNLAISFEVMNSGPRDILVTSMKAGLRSRGLSGLRELRTTSGGGCDNPGIAPAAGMIASGQSQLFTFWYRRPAACSRAWQANVPVQARQMVGTTTTSVRKEIGTLTFNNNCPGS
jgi:hypothetical protein